MQLPRFVGLVDLAIATVVLVTVVLPAREMYASAAYKADEPAHFALAVAEARTMAHPDDGAAIDAFARKLGEAGFKDWAIEAALRGSEKAKSSPTRWKALLATSVAYVDKLDVVPALDYANRALASCESAGGACPSWEQIRMELYQQHLDAGVKSGIDPRRNPLGFRRAGESGLRGVRLKSSEREQTRNPGGAGSAAPPPTTPANP
jgi:hypothetical protein